MLKKHVAACLAVTALAMAPAFAQTATAPSTDRPVSIDNRSGAVGSPAMNAPSGATTLPGAGGTTAPAASPSTASGATGAAQPNAAVTTTQPAVPGTGSGAPTVTQPNVTMPGTGTTAVVGGTSPAGGGFIATPEQGQWLASRLIGMRVTGSNDERVGDINDVLMDRDGQAVAAIIGVGGFLGIGEKNVAVPFSALQITPDVDRTGATGADGTTGTSGATANVARAPGRVVLGATKDQLKAAPAFRSTGIDPEATGATGSRAPGATGGSSTMNAPATSPSGGAPAGGMTR